MNWKVIFACLLGFYSTFCASQNVTADSSQILKEIIILGTKVEIFSVGSKFQNIKKSDVSEVGNLADLLQNESPIFIKSYGLGGLATTSFRGGSASHTAVIWNGIPLNSAMNGQLDLSLIPTKFVESVNIQYGGASALCGSGAIGGSIHLNNNPTFEDGISLTYGVSVGSFSNIQNNFSLKISSHKWSIKNKFFVQSGINDFEFYNPSLRGNPLQKQQNAASKQVGFFSENYYKINKKQEVNFLLWLQKNERNIPPILLQSASNAKQKDSNLRLSAQWKYIGSKVNYQIKTAYLDEGIYYEDPGFNIFSDSRAKTFLVESEAKIQLGDSHLIDFGLNATNVTGYSDGYLGKLAQFRNAIFVAYKYNSPNRRLQTSLSLRQEWLNKKVTPFTYSLGANYNLTQYLSLKSNISRVFRVPTFNDLYWRQGGNLNLLSEKGFSEELGLVLNYRESSKRFSVFFEPTVFNRNVENWILWLPGLSFWSPRNILNVWSRGLETRLNLKLEYHKTKYLVDLLTNYVLSSNQKSISENDNSVNKQLIYVPMYAGHLKYGIDYQSFNLHFSHHYTGYRYTSTDNTEFLKPFLLSNLEMNYGFLYKNYNIQTGFKINNIFNTRYQILLNQAMPMSNFQTSFFVTYHHKNNK